MGEALHFSSSSSFLHPLSNTNHSFPSKPSSLFPQHPHPLSPPLLSSLRSPPTFIEKTLTTSTTSPTIPSSTTISPHFHEKLLFLDSLNLDHLSLLSSHPQIISAPLSDLKSTVRFLLSLNLTHLDLRRILTMCPEILTSSPHSLASSVSFLLREAAVPSRQLPHAIHRRPRLLVSDVPSRLRPTLYFLQMLGIADTSRHSYLLSCSVEDKLIPRIDFFTAAGLAPRDARLMFRRFPQLFCYGIANLELKLGFLVGEMGREMKEAREFPQYFSYSLERRIKRRHLACEEKGVRFALPAMLRPSDEEFRERVEVCVGSSPPLRNSPLWYQGLDSSDR